MRTLSTVKSLLLPIGLAIIGVLAVIVMTGSAPQRAAASLRSAKPTSFVAEAQLSLVEGALSDFKANERLADSAPQQQVVAGWVTRDLLSAIAMQNAYTMRGIEAVNDNVIEMQTLQTNITEAIEAAAPPIDDRPRRLLALAVLALCWIGMWSVVPLTGPRRADVADTPADQPAVAPTIPSPPAAAEVNSWRSPEGTA